MTALTTEHSRPITVTETSPSALTARIGAVSLFVRDLQRMIAYYRHLLALAVVEETGTSCVLGVGDTPLLRLVHRPDMGPDSTAEAGLYHTAFLMPDRKSLARWIVHAIRNRIPVSGASDHDVSEAIYLDDPEGNGVEIYADRPSELWKRDGGIIFQKTDPLDIEAILTEIDPETDTYAAPSGLSMGHIHLRVGDIEEAEAFYQGVLGLDITRRRGGATFLSSQGYHHHIAVNTWQSPTAGSRDPDLAGMDYFELFVSTQDDVTRLEQRLRAAGAPISPIATGFMTRDPWSLKIHVVLAPASRA